METSPVKHVKMTLTPERALMTMAKPGSPLLRHLVREKKLKYGNGQLVWGGTSDYADCVTQKINKQHTMCSIAAKFMMVRIIFQRLIRQMASSWRVKHKNLVTL